MRGVYCINDKFWRGAVSVFHLFAAV